MGNFRDLCQTRIRHGHNPDVWIDSAKRLIFRLCLMRPRNGVKKRRLPDVWQSYNSGAEHDSVVAAFDRRKRATLRERRYS